MGRPSMCCQEHGSSARSATQLEQGQGGGYMGIRFYWPEVLHLKKGSETKTQPRSHGVAFKILHAFRDERCSFQSHSALELKSSCKYFYTEPGRSWTSIMKKQEFLNKVHLKYLANYLKNRITFFIFIFFFYAF